MTNQRENVTRVLHVLVLLPVRRAFLLTWEESETCDGYHKRLLAHWQNPVLSLLVVGCVCVDGSIAIRGK